MRQCGVHWKQGLRQQLGCTLSLTKHQLKRTWLAKFKSTEGTGLEHLRKERTKGSFESVAEIIAVSID
jgi:hypothetical protein